ncbi:MAG: PIN domain-containing protein [Actinomycetota bacterium]
MRSLLLDTHVLYWLWSGSVDRLSASALSAIESADELLVAAITWYELALLLERGRIELVETTAPAALASMADRVTTALLTWPIAVRAAGLERSPEFPRDPADRLIFATASERGVRLVTGDGRLRRFSSEICLW